MKKVTIVFDFESQSMDVSVNDARECVTPATTVEEMLANEVFAFRPVKTSHYVVLHYADIVWVEASNNNSVFHMEDLWQAGGNPQCHTCRGDPCGRPHPRAGASPAPTVFPGNACGVHKRNYIFVGIIPAKPLNDAQTGGGAGEREEKSVFLVDNTEGNHYLCTSKR